MLYTKIPTNTFQTLQLNAGILIDSFNPVTGEIGNLLGATNGGINFSASPTFIDFGEDIDNCPKNTKELMQLDDYEVTMGGTFLSITGDNLKMLNVLADKTTSSGVVKVVPRKDILTTDFQTIWWVGDYSDVNTGDSAGYMAIKMMNAMNTDGFQIQSGDKAKGQFAFNFKGHFSIDAQDTVPYEIYLRAGNATVIPSIDLDTHYVELTVGDTYTFAPTVIPSTSTVTWASSASGKASVSSGVVTAAEAGSTIITASITESGVTYSDTCTVVVKAAASS